MAIYALGELTPQIDPAAFVHPDAVVIGNVVIGPEASIWPTAVLRGDYAPISIGAQTSIQDGVVIHVSHDLPTSIGARCVVGHNAHIEGATVEDDAMVGSGSVVMHRALVRSRSIVAAGAVVLDDTEIPRNSLAVGVPAKIREGVVADGAFDWNVQMYVRNVAWYKRELRRLD